MLDAWCKPQMFVLHSSVCKVDARSWHINQSVGKYLHLMYRMLFLRAVGVGPQLINDQQLA